MIQTERQLLAEALCQLAPNIMSSVDPAWSRPPALRVIDCVLSLMRSYDNFVVPRLNAFHKRFPHVANITDLNTLVSSYGSPGDFVADALNYRDESRAAVLAAVISWLVPISGDGDTPSQLANLERWAKDASYADYRVTCRIHGFGLAGFQYLRMLFGADTIKPDLRICQWVAGTIGRPVSAPEALMLLESVAPEVGVSLRNVDTTIWEMLARPQRVNSAIEERPSGLQALRRAWELASETERAHFLEFIEQETSRSG